MASTRKMTYLQRGSNRPEVSYLKRLLNLQTGANLAEGKTLFGGHTDAAVRKFQSANGLTPDGIVGNLTWGALGVQIGIDYPLRLIPQPAPRLCWKAASKMVLLGRDPRLGPIVEVDANTGKPLDGSHDDGQRLKMRRDGAIFLGRSAVDIDHGNVALFARRQGWRKLPAKLPLEALLEAMGQGPLVVVGVARGMGHAVVFSAIWSDGSPQGTFVRVHDPFPNNHGAIYAASPVEPKVRGMAFTVHAHLVPQAGNQWGGTYVVFEENIQKPDVRAAGR